MIFNPVDVQVATRSVQSLFPYDGHHIKLLGIQGDNRIQSRQRLLADPQFDRGVFRTEYIAFEEVVAQRVVRRYARSAMFFSCEAGRHASSMLS